MRYGYILKTAQKSIGVFKQQGCVTELTIIDKEKFEDDVREIDVSRVENLGAGLYKTSFKFFNYKTGWIIGSLKKITAKKELERIAKRQSRNGRYITGMPGIAGYQEMENKVNCMRASNIRASERMVEWLEDRLN